MFTIALPFVGILQALDRFISLFADNDEGADKTDEENEDKFVDDLDNEFGEGDDEDDEDDEDEKGDDDEGDKSKKKDYTKKSDKRDSSAVRQKQKYREKLKVAQDRISELEGKKGDLTVEEKKEKAAKEYLAQAIKEVLADSEKEKSAEERKIQEQFDDELDEVLEENTDITEDQILDVCEELDVSPKQALKAIRREQKLTGKKKPKMPDNKRGDGDVSDTNKKKGDDKKPSTFESANRFIKEQLKKGLL